MPASINWRGKALQRPSLTQLARDGARGRAWYRDSGASIAAYAAEREKPTRYVCDVVAILSPRVSVVQNVKLASEYLETGDIRRGVMRSRRRALQRYECWGEVKGPKVTAFASALAGNGDAVVIDAWVYRLFGVDKPNARTYRETVAKIRRVATLLGWEPAETQAALWVGARALCGFSDAYSPIRMARDAS